MGALTLTLDEAAAASCAGLRKNDGGCPNKQDGGARLLFALVIRSIKAPNGGLGTIGGLKGLVVKGSSIPHSLKGNLRHADGVR